MNHFRSSALGLALTLALSASAFADPIATGFNSSTLGPSDDGSSASVELGFNIDFFGSAYSSVFVNNNGNITFGEASSSYTPFGLAGSSQAIIAPFFADVDTRGAGSGVASWGTGTYAGNQAWGATWSNVGYYSAATDKLNSFQVILVNRSDVAEGDFDIYMNYGNILWETGDASGGSDGLGGSCAVAGYSNGTVADANQVTYQQAGSATCGALIDGGVNALSTNTNDGVTGQYLFTDRSGVVSQAPTQTPVPEPSSIALLGTGILGAAGALRRKISRS